MLCGRAMGELQLLQEDTGAFTRVKARVADGAVSAGDLLRAWARGGEGCDTITTLIAGSPHAAVFWEMPPLTTTRLGMDFECVLVGSRALARLPRDEKTFSEHFGDEGAIAVFDNLGGDATLIAPLPQPPGADYSHLASFCRKAPREIGRLFWQRLAETALRRMSDRPLWISTAGLGVGWLHARLDTRPKYYSHAPYRRWPQ